MKTIRNHVPEGHYWHYHNGWRPNAFIFNDPKASREVEDLLTFYGHWLDNYSTPFYFSEKKLQVLNVHVESQDYFYSTDRKAKNFFLRDFISGRKIYRQVMKISERDRWLYDFHDVTTD